MSILNKNSFCFNEQSNVIAKKAIAGFLKQLIDDISCKRLTGGSDENSIVKCTYLKKNYIVKFFNSAESGKNELLHAQHIPQVTMSIIILLF